VPPSSEHPDLSRSLALIGGRGCGKSSVSKRLARRNKNFMLLSIDTLIRYERGGMLIPQIVEREGWAGFRKLEYEVVCRVAAFESGALIDCGGGIVVDLDSGGHEVYSKRKVAALKRSSAIVYLSRDFEYLRGRIKGDVNRPSLSNAEGFIEIMERRDPWYRKAADHVIDCNDKTKLEIAEDVLHWFYDEIGVEYTADSD
jgi:shikimate kinase